MLTAGWTVAGPRRRLRAMLSLQGHTHNEAGPKEFQQSMQIIRQRACLFLWMTQLVATLANELTTISAGSSLLASINLGFFLLAAASAHLIGAIASPSRSATRVRFWRNVVDGFTYLRAH